MYAAMIDVKPGISKLDQTLFLKRLLKNCKTEIQDNHIVIKKYDIPIDIENPSEKAILKFCEFLKNEKIGYVFVTDAVKQVKPVYDALSKNFSFFTGLSVINYKTCDIIRKYAGGKNQKLSDALVLLETDEPQKAEDIIHQIYRRVKRIAIRTKKEESFSDLADRLLKEYGLFVSVNDAERPDIHIELDSMILSSGHLNLSADENRASKILFKLQNKKEYDQFYLEFLIFCQYGVVNKKTIKDFFNQHSVRISKIL